MNTVSYNVGNFSVMLEIFKFLALFTSSTSRWLNTFAHPKRSHDALLMLRRPYRYALYQQKSPRKCINLQIQASESTQGSSVPVLGHQVNVVDTFVYLGSSIDQDGGSDIDIRRRIELARSCMRALDSSIWRTSISLSTKLRLYSIYILPVLLYGADMWSMTVTARRRLNAYDQWCMWRILRTPYRYTCVKSDSPQANEPASSNQYHPRPTS